MTTFNRFGGGTANLPLGTLKRVIIPASGSSTLAEETNYDTIQENGTWIKENAVYLQSDYSELFDTIGLINAANFTPRSSGTVSNITSVIYGNDLWVLGTTTRYYASSTDAVTWTGNADVPQTSTGVAYGNGVYVTAGFWGIATSTNAARDSWTAASVTTRSNTDLVFGNGKFAVISTTGNVNYSTDGTTWTEVTPAAVTLRTIASTEGFFVAAGGSASNVWTSTDAVSWTVSTLGTTTNATYRKIISDGTDLLLVGDSSAQFIGETSNQLTEMFTTPGTYSWTCPAGVTSVYVVCVGGGGGGARWSSTIISPAAGGGGLGWKNVTVTPGKTYTVVVGAAGVGTSSLTAAGDGGASLFYDSELYNALDDYPVGQAEFTTPGTYSWTAPAGVTSVSVVCVGAGGGPATNTNGASGGGGGGLGWKNNISVTPGQSYTVVVGAGGARVVTGTAPSGGASHFIDASTVAGLGGAGAIAAGNGSPAGGGFVGDGGGNGGAGGNRNSNTSSAGGGGGAGGYSGNGGAGAAVGGSASPGAGGGGAGGITAAGAGGTAGAGGGVGLYGEGSSGLVVSIGGGGGSFGYNATSYSFSTSLLSAPGMPGGGGAGGDTSSLTIAPGADGAVRIIWGLGRAFPSTNTRNLTGNTRNPNILVAGFGGQGGTYNLPVLRFGGDFIGDGGGFGGNGGRPLQRIFSDFHTGGPGGAGGYLGRGGNGRSILENTTVGGAETSYGIGGGGGGGPSRTFSSGSGNISTDGAGGVGINGIGSSGLIEGGGSGGTDGNTNGQGGLFGGAGSNATSTGLNGGSGAVSITYSVDSPKKLAWKNLLTSGGHGNNTISPMFAKNNKILSWIGALSQLQVTTTDYFSSVRISNNYPSSIGAFGHNNNVFVIGGNSSSILRSSDGGDSWLGSTTATIDDVTTITYGGAGIWVAGFTSGAINTSTDAVTWTARTSATSSRIHQISFGNNLFVRAGAAGQLGSSTDAVTWTARTSGATNSIFTVTYGTTWVYGGFAGAIRTSTDGTTWTARTSNTTSDILSMTYGPNVGRYLAVGVNGLITTSTDAITWTTQTVSTITTRSLTNAEYDNGNFYVSGAGGVFLTTTNLSNWNFVGIPPSVEYGSPAGIAYGNGLYVMASATGFVSTSTDRILWTVPVKPTNSVVSTVDYANGVFVLAGTGGILGTSTDGTNWYIETDAFNRSVLEQVYNSSVIGNTIYYGTQGASAAGIFELEIQDRFTPYQYNAAEHIFTVQNSFNTTQQINKLVYENNNFVAVGNAGVIRQSVDGRSWYTARWARTTSSVSSVAYGNGIYVAVSSVAGITHVSTDAYNWKPYGLNNTAGDVKLANNKILFPTTSGNFYVADPTDPYNFRWHATGTTLGLNSSDYGNGLYVTVGASGTIRTTPDLYENWTARTSGTASNLRNVLYLNNNFIAVGDGGAMVTSTNAVTWTASTSGATTTIWSAAYGNTVYVAVGHGGYVRSSTDLVTWTARTAGSNTYYAVTYANNSFITVGTAGAIRTSTDGVTWNLKTSGTTTALFSINYANNLYVAGGVNGTILTSTDAETWTAVQAPTASTINNILYANNTWIYTTQIGNIGTSTDAVNWNMTNRELFGLITFGNGLFVAATATGVFTSTNNTNWVNRATATTTIRQVTYQNNLYFYTGDSGMLATSTDAVTWTVRSTGTLQQINSVDYKDNLYAIVGNGGFFATSTDGITWNPRVSGVANNLLAIESNNSYSAVIGETGTLLSTDDVTELEYSPAYDATTEFFIPNFTEAQSIETIGGASEEYFVVCGSGTNLNVYPWNDTTGFGVRYSTSGVNLPNIAGGVAFHPSMKAIMSADAATNAPVAIKWDSVTGFGERYSNATGTGFANILSDGFGISNTGNAAVVSSTATTGGDYARVWPFSIDTGFGTVLANYSTTSPNLERRTFKWHPDNNYVLVGAFGSSFNNGILEWNDTVGFNTGQTTGFLIDGPEYRNVFAWHPSGTRYISPGVRNTSTGQIPWRTYSFPANSTIATLNLGDAISYTSLNFSPSGNDVVLGATDGVRVHARSFTLASGLGNAYSDVTAGNRPTGAAVSAQFSPSGNAVIVTHAVTPFITAIRFTSGVGWGTKYSDPSVLPTAAPVGNLSIGTITRDPTTFSQANQQTYIKAKI